MKKLELNQMENVEGGSVESAIACGGAAWGAAEFVGVLVAAASGPIGWLALGTLILGPALVGTSLAECIAG